MSVRDARVFGVPARLMRVSFTGELGYEINVGSAYGLDVWKAVFAAVEAHGGCAYGTEAMHVLRAEKGYVIVGQETDGTVTPADLGLDWAIGKAKADFVGKRSLELPELAREGRKQLVGLLTEDPALVLEEGAQVTESATPPVGSRALGHVTSSYRSPAAGRSIALALVAGGRARIGQRVHVSTPAGRAVARDGRSALRLRPARERASMSDASIAEPLADAALSARRRDPAVRTALCDRGRSARRPLRRPRRRGRAAGVSAAFGAELPARLGPAGRSGERAALWLGPDEWLLIAEGGRSRRSPPRSRPASPACLTAWSTCRTAQVGLIVSGAVAARASSTPAARSICG